VQTRCTDASLYTGADGASRFDEVAACRADMTTAGTTFAPRPADSAASWLFCACSRPLIQILAEEWFDLILLAANLALFFLVSLFCALCCVCRAASKAKVGGERARATAMAHTHARDARDATHTPAPPTLDSPHSPSHTRRPRLTLCGRQKRKKFNKLEQTKQEQAEREGFSLDDEL
jgi:hypothetical protein